MRHLPIALSLVACVVAASFAFVTMSRSRETEERLLAALDSARAHRVDPGPELPPGSAEWARWDQLAAQIAATNARLDRLADRLEAIERAAGPRPTDRSRYEGSPAKSGWGSPAPTPSGAESASSTVAPLAGIELDFCSFEPVTELSPEERAALGAAFFEGIDSPGSAIVASTWDSKLHGFRFRSTPDRALSPTEARALRDYSNLYLRQRVLTDAPHLAAESAGELEEYPSQDEAQTRARGLTAPGYPPPTVSQLPNGNYAVVGGEYTRAVTNELEAIRERLAAIESASESLGGVAVVTAQQ